MRVSSVDETCFVRINSLKTVTGSNANSSRLMGRDTPIARV